MNKRFALSSALLIANILALIAVTFVFVVAMLYQPQPRWVFAIRAADLREGEPVRAAGPDGILAYVVQFGDAITAYSARAPTGNRCTLIWNADRRLFFDGGCVGAQFDVTGQWIAGPALRELDRHPVVLYDGWVAVDTRTITLGRDFWKDFESESQ